MYVFKRCNFPAGRVLGGTSVLNYMLYVRGNKRDYDRWAAEGNYGWSYEEVLPYFKKSEDNQNPYIAQNSNTWLMEIWTTIFHQYVNQRHSLLS